MMTCASRSPRKRGSGGILCTFDRSPGRQRRTARSPLAPEYLLRMFMRMNAEVMMRGMKGMVGSAGGDPVAKRNTNLSLAESLVAEAKSSRHQPVPGLRARAGGRDRRKAGGLMA